jgi:hypothetical protein
LAFVVCTTCTRGASDATQRDCLAARRSVTTIRQETTTTFSGEILFSQIVFFPFSPFLAETEHASADAECGSNGACAVRRRWQQLAFVISTICNREASDATLRNYLAARRSQTASRPATTVSGNCFSRNYFFLFSFLTQSERVSVGGDCASNDMQISQSTWQDLCLVVWSSCNREYQSCSDLRLSCST